MQVRAFETLIEVQMAATLHAFQGNPCGRVHKGKRARLSVECPRTAVRGCSRCARSYKVGYGRPPTSAQFQLGQSGKSEIATTRGGFRLATSVDGTLTGRGGHIMIIDDPLKPSDASSDTKREHVNEWFKSTLFSRLAISTDFAQSFPKKAGDQRKAAAHAF